MLPKTLGILIPLSLTCLLAACASTPERTAPQDDPKREQPWSRTPVQFRADEVQEYKHIQVLYGQGQYEEAWAELQKFYKRFPKTSRAAEVMNLHALIDLKSQRYTEALQRFQQALKLSNDPRFKQYIYYNMAAARFEMGQIPEAEKALNLIDDKNLAVNLAGETQYKYWYLKALVQFQKGAVNDSLNSLMMASPLLTQSSLPQNRILMDKHMERCLDRVTGVVDLEALIAKYPESPMLDALHFALGKRAMEAGDKTKAEHSYGTIVKQFPNSGFYSDALDKLTTIQKRNTADPSRIGVLVPTTGKFAKMGEQTLQGVKLGFGLAGKQTDSFVKLAVEDAGESPEDAVAALEKLYYEQKVAAVIGPIVGPGTDKIVERANDLGLPLLSLSQRSVLKSPTDRPEYAFQFAPGPREQAYEIARYAIQSRGWKRIAILYPGDDFGKTYMNHFWDAVEEMGGEITAAEMYPPTETDFSTVVEKAGGLFYVDARRDELDSMAAARRRDNVIRRTQKNDQYWRLPPVVEYDAVFIPDVPKTIGQILPMFAYKDIDDVNFLGVSTWNSPTLITRAKGYTDRTFFVDTYFPGAEHPKAQRFLQNFQTAYGIEPSSLSALGYDAAVLLNQTLTAMAANRQSASRDEIRNQLRNISAFGGATGNLMIKDGFLQRKMAVLGIRGGLITDEVN